MRSGIRIMVASDDDRLRDIVSQALSGDGHDVTKIASGVEAMDAFRKNPVSLVIAGIEMKGMSGIKLLREVKQHCHDSEVILMTNYPAVETAIEALRYEASDYIMNAFDSLDQISSAVNHAIEKIKQTEEQHKLVDMLTKQNQELEQSWTTFKESAARDEVTGLYNARYFQEALAVELNRSSHSPRNLSVVFLDVKWNCSSSARGPEEKARLLCTISRIIIQRLRKSDLLVRYRDDTFAMLLPDTPRDGARRVIESIRRLLSEYPFQGPERDITVGLRMAVYPEDGANGAALISNATPY